MCRVLEVSRSALYAWRRRPRRSAHQVLDTELASQIHEIHSASRGTYGSPRVHAKLRRDGVRTGRKRVERLMRAEGLRGRIRRRFRKTTDSNHALPVAPNTLNRQFAVESPDKAWAGDITYIPTASGWGYLADLELEAREELPGLGRRAADGLARWLEDPVVAGAEEARVLRLPVDLAAEVRAGRGERDEVVGGSVLAAARERHLLAGLLLQGPRVLPFLLRSAHVPPRPAR